MKFGIRGQLTDVITCVKFSVDRFSGYGVLTPQKLPFPIDLLRRPYNSVRTNVLHCDYLTHELAHPNLIINWSIPTISPCYPVSIDTVIYTITNSKAIPSCTKIYISANYWRATITVNNVVCKKTIITLAAGVPQTFGE